MTTRREFLGSAAALGAAVYWGATRTKSAARDVADDPEVGKAYVGWKEGDFDLHFIHTGVGECAFYIYPDGTTALVDAGDWKIADYGENGAAPRPNGSKRPGEWIARYISRLLPELKTIDYAVASHFHSDHTGEVRVGAGMKGLSDPDADYQISGIAHVGEYYRFGKAFDRGYPDYSRPTPWAPEERENLVRFWKYAESEYGLKRERFEVGALDQLGAVRAPDRYAFHIRNVAANGVVWENGAAVDYFAKNAENNNQQNENTRSLAWVVEYGPFRFYAGGDLSGFLRDAEGQNADFEGAVGRAVGRVDVCKANHHSYKDAMTKSFVNAVAPRVFVVCVWDRWHFQENTTENMCDDSMTGYPGPRMICPTTIHPLSKPLLEGKSWRKNVVEREGHVVVKAYDGGARYKVYYLSAQDESMTVDAVYGPFESGKSN